MEVQNHGVVFEDQIIVALTGLTKKEYSQNFGINYTSHYDLQVDKQFSFNYPISIKTSSSDKVGLGDVERFRYSVQNDSFILLIGCYQQVKDVKIFYCVYEFFIKPSNSLFLLGTVSNQMIHDFVTYVKSIPPGKKFQLENQKIWKNKRDEILKNYDTGLISIDAKIDSKNQRRVQCGLKISDLLDSEISCIKYETSYFGVQLPYVIQSQSRTFKKS